VSWSSICIAEWVHTHSSVAQSIRFNRPLRRTVDYMVAIAIALLASYWILGGIGK